MTETGCLRRRLRRAWTAQADGVAATARSRARPSRPGRIDGWCAGAAARRAAGRRRIARARPPGSSPARPTTSRSRWRRSGTAPPTTTAAGRSTTSAPGTSVPSPTTVAPGRRWSSGSRSTTTARARRRSAPTHLALLVADETPTGILSSTLRIEVDPRRRSATVRSVKVRGSQFPPARHGRAHLGAAPTGSRPTTLNQGAGWCDIATAQGFSAGRRRSWSAPMARSRAARLRSCDGTCRPWAAPTTAPWAPPIPTRRAQLREQGLLGPAPTRRRVGLLGRRRGLRAPCRRGDGDAEHHARLPRGHRRDR